MLGRSVVEQFQLLHPADKVVGVGREDLDLRDIDKVHALIAQEKPDAVVHAAAKVGGIGWKLAEPTAFLTDNLVMDAAVITSALDAGVSELVYIASAAVYPAAYERPYIEDDLLTGKLEPVNEGYALAKTAGIKACEYASKQFGVSFRSVLPSNLYGIYDHFDPDNAHLIAAALGKVHRAKRDESPTVEVWGDGTARREFTYSVDVATWIAQRIGRLDELPPMLNLGFGTDHSIAEFYEIAKQVVGYDGELVFDTSKPSGVPRRLINSTLAAAYGWSPKTGIFEGMTKAYKDFLSREES